MKNFPETIRLFDDRPYDTEFDAVILDVQYGKTPGTAMVVLDQTLFFPEEGGQTPDRGQLAGCQVVDVQISKDGVITHTLALREVCAQAHSGTSDTPDGASGPENLPARVQALAPGRTVHGVLDWAHRFSNMQNHSGEHVLSGLLHSIYGFENVGFRLSDHTVTLDTGGHLTPEQLLDLERRANEVVWRNVPVTCEYPEPERLRSMEYRSKKELDGAVRIVTIEGVDVCACCAPHVRRTGEIGLIKILSAIHSRGGSTRMTLVCGSRALEVMQQRQEQTEECSRLMNAPQEAIAGGVERLQAEISGLKEEIRRREERIVELRLAEALEAASSGAPSSAPGDAAASGISAAGQASPAPGNGAETGGRDLWIFEPALSPLSRRGLMNRLCDMGWRCAGVFAGSDEEGYQYLIGSRSSDARIPNQLLRETFMARGGGKPAMVQGSVAASEAAIREVLSRF